MYDDQWDAATDQLYENAELWERLIGGDCDRVVVLGPAGRRSMLELCFPQTLGLPPLRYSIGYSRAEHLGRVARRGEPCRVPLVAAFGARRLYGA